MNIKKRLIKFLQDRKKIINLSALEEKADCPRGSLSTAVNSKMDFPSKHFEALMHVMIPIFYAKDFEEIYNDYVEQNRKISTNIVLSYVEDNDSRYSVYWLKANDDFPKNFGDELKFNLSRFGYRFTIQSIIYKSNLVSVRVHKDFSPDQVEFMVSEVFDSLYKPSIKSK